MIHVKGKGLLLPCYVLQKGSVLLHSHKERDKTFRTRMKKQL